MEVSGALGSVLFAAFSLPLLLLLLLLLLVLGEAGVRFAALALRGRGYAWPTRSAFLGYRIARAGGHLSYSSAAGGGIFQQEETTLLPPECLDRLAVSVYRRGASQAAVDCVFCLSRIDEGEEVRELRCRHVFHRACLDGWLLRSRATCPLCRDRVLPSEPRSDYAVDDDADVVNSQDYLSSASSYSPAASSYALGGALWHM